MYQITHYELFYAHYSKIFINFKEIRVGDFIGQKIYIRPGNQKHRYFFLGLTLLDET